MKKIVLLLSMIILSSSFVIGQTKTFVSSIANLEFTYPTSLTQEKINNAPHMLLKLMGKTNLLALSFWDYGIDESLDAWDDDLFSRIKSRMALASGEVVSLEKVTLAINGRSIRAVEIITNESNSYQGQTFKSYSITYQIWYKGNLVQVVYSVFGSHYKSGSDKGRNLIKGLKLK